MSKTNLNLVFIPFPIMSHLVSAVETAKLLTKRNQNLSITVLIMKLPVDTKIDDHIKNSPNSRINFIELPQNIIHIMEIANSPDFIYLFVESQKELVKLEIAKIASESKVAGIVMDLFCSAMVDVGKELGVSSYMFFTCGAAFLGMMFYLQSIRDDQNVNLNDLAKLGNELSIPTYVHPVPISVLPNSIVDGDKKFVDLAKQFREMNGILLNTFQEFEPHSIFALKNDEKIPSVYPIGPLLHTKQEESDENREKHDKVISWLNEQSDSSVVYLCFGTNGSFEEDQVKEIAIALEKSGLRFLWSLRKPPPKGSQVFPGEYEDFDEVLPNGFLNRTSDVGKVIGWAPQMEVLSHRATGGFVSHCGWNSTLESVYYGVPMAVWPLFAEQQMNAFVLVKDLKMAVEVQMDYKHNKGMIVGAEKIENAIRELMDPENEIRGKAKIVQKSCQLASSEGGSSYESLNRLLNDLNES